MSYSIQNCLNWNSSNYITEDLFSTSEAAFQDHALLLLCWSREGQKCFNLVLYRLLHCIFSTSTKRSEHISLVPVYVNWLPMGFRIRFKILLLGFSSFKRSNCFKLLLFYILIVLFSPDFITSIIYKVLCNVILKSAL